MVESLSTSEIRRLGAKYDSPRLITDTIPALCDEVDRLHTELARSDRPASRDGAPRTEEVSLRLRNRSLLVAFVLATAWGTVGWILYGLCS